MTKIVQITDPHLGPDKEYRLAGIQTISSFEVVLEDALEHAPDLLLITGDIVADPDPAAYRYFFAAMEATGVPMVWLPGNHDDAKMAESVINSTRYEKSHDVGNWRLLLLDSMVPGTPNGCLGDDELVFFEKAMAENTQDHLLICLHHHPIKVGSDWIDQQLVADSEKFLQIVESTDRVRMVVWGHVHQVVEQMRGDVFFASAPSTCIQFKSNSRNFALSDEQPGYRIIELFDDGRVETQVQRVEVPQFEVALESEGY